VIKKHKRKEKRRKEGREEGRNGTAARDGGKPHKEAVCLLPREVENLLLVGLYICRFQQYVIDTTNSYVLLSTYTTCAKYQDVRLVKIRGNYIYSLFYRQYSICNHPSKF
jgi:hypothetical protein